MKTGKRVIVCGGRTYDCKAHLFHHLDTLHEADPIGVLIEGGARGADRLAKAWAILSDVDVTTYMAQWHNFGAAAGAIRNRTMLEHGKPDLVVAFPGGVGTANMVKIARKAGVPVIEVKEMS